MPFDSFFDVSLFCGDKVIRHGEISSICGRTLYNINLDVPWHFAELMVKHLWSHAEAACLRFRKKMYWNNWLPWDII